MLRSASALLLLATLNAAELQLANGEVFEGEVVSDTPTEIRMRIVEGGMTAERSWPRAEITRLLPGAGTRSLALAGLRGEAAALPTTATAAQWTQLALRAKAAGDAALARAWAGIAVARDRHQTEAQGLLGRELVNGIWMRPHEAAAARGLVWYEARWISWRERERLRAEEAERMAKQREAMAALADRRVADARRSAVYDPLDEWPQRQSFRADTPLKVIWWGGGYPAFPVMQPAFHPGPVLRINANGGWGGVHWNLNLNW